MSKRYFFLLITSLLLFGGMVGVFLGGKFEAKKGTGELLAQLDCSSYHDCRSCCRYGIQAKEEIII